ncbi:hypothetical protein KKB18_01495 [bacterium]|nr:hypothetical protein [bacterium]
MNSLKEMAKLSIKNLYMRMSDNMREKVFIFILLLASLFYGGCKTISSVVIKDRVSDNLVIYKMNITTPLSEEDRKLNLYLSAQIVDEPRDYDLYNFILIQKGKEKELLDIAEGKTLILVIDGLQYPVKTDKQMYEKEAYSFTLPIPGETKVLQGKSIWRDFKHREKSSTGDIFEKVCYEATLEDIERVANAGEVEVIVLGKDERFVRKSFLPVHFEKFKEFVGFCKERNAKNK